MTSVRKLSALTGKLIACVKRSHDGGAKAPCPVKELVLSVMIEEMPPRSALVAVNRIQRAFVDWNEVRVSLLHQIAEAMNDGSGDLSRADRIRTILCRVFEKFNSMSLDPLIEKSRSEAVRLITYFIKPPKPTRRKRGGKSHRNHERPPTVLLAMRAARQALERKAALAKGEKKAIRSAQSAAPATRKVAKSTGAGKKKKVTKSAVRRGAPANTRKRKKK